jgi:two-component system, OmpR family, phosphate regulon sensor histidine kinase PhoR
MKIGLPLSAAFGLLGILETYRFGFSWASVGIQLCAAAMVVGLVYWILRPLKRLERVAQRIAGTDSFVAGKHSAFGGIEYALELLEQQIEFKTMELAKNQERFGAVLSGMDEGVIAIDEAGRVLIINRAARMMLSIDLKSVVGKPLLGLVRYETVQQAVRDVFKSEKTITTNFRTHDEKPREVRLRVAPMAGHPLPGLTLVFHDLTDLMRLETIRRDFVANVSHELKTPLASIKGYAETLLMGAIDKVPHNRQFLEQIDKQADLLNIRIHDLLHLARIESGKEAFSHQAVDLIQLCQETVAKFSDEANRLTTKLDFENEVPDHQRCLVWADDDAMRTVIENLISNALRYSQIVGRQNHRPKVRIVVKSKGLSAIVDVIDNGIGISKEHQERVFERFFRVDPARSREMGGTGLGLAIVKHLVHSFGGQVELESKLGLGSTFRAVFPRFRAKE